MVTGRVVVVVVVGRVVVVVVVVGVLPVVDGVDVDEDVDEDVDVEVVGADVVVVLELAAELAPGCSFATTIPINVVAPAAATTEVRVKRRRRTCARARDSGEFSGLFKTEARFFSSARVHLRFPTSPQAQSSLWTFCEVQGS